MSTRPPPPDGPQPATTRLLRKAYPYSLRPVVLFVSTIVFLWGMIAGISRFKDLGESDELKSEKKFDAIVGILLVVTAIMGAIGIAAGSLQRISLSRIFAIAAPVGLATSAGAAIVALIETTTLKGDLIDNCVQELQDDGFISGDNNSTSNTVSFQGAVNACNSDWNRELWRNVIWLVIVALIGFVAVSVALAYHRQLLDPNSVRSYNRTTNPAPAYPLQGYPQYQTGPPNGWVPPYPGPPPPNSQFAPVPGYSGPSGDPFADADAKRDVPGYDTTYEAQDRAWREAQQNGPTSHLTGNGGAQGQGLSFAAPSGPPPGRNERSGAGYEVAEEEEAWQRARTEGVTAHLTGDRLGEGGKAV